MIAAAVPSRDSLANSVAFHLVHLGITFKCRATEHLLCYKYCGFATVLAVWTVSRFTRELISMPMSSVVDDWSG